MDKSRSKSHSGRTESPAQLRAIFGQNLKWLMEGEQSVAQLCRTLGINRTQFNRYLSGEAFPRPDVLQTICRHFRTDARILLDPLPFDRADSASRLARALDRYVLQDQQIGFDHMRLPDGIYRFHRPSFQFAERLIVSLARIFTDAEGSKVFRALSDRDYSRSIGAPLGARARAFHGVLFQHSNGVSLLCETPLSKSLNFNYFGYGYRGVDRYYPGYSCLTQPQIGDQSNRVPTMLEYLPQDLHTLIEARRGCGSVGWSRLPPAFRDFFSPYSG